MRQIMPVVQVAFISGKPSEALVSSLSRLPLDSLVLVCRREDLALVKARADVIRPLLGVDVSIEPLEGDLIESAVEILSRLVAEFGGEVIVNLGGADAELAVVGLSAAYLLGLRTFTISDGKLLELPVVRKPILSFISKEKVEVLVALLGSGDWSTLEDLSGLTKRGRAVLSYHIHGSERTPGLADMGLVEVRRRGKVTEVSLTPTGRALAISAKSLYRLNSSRQASRGSS